MTILEFNCAHLATGKSQSLYFQSCTTVTVTKLTWGKIIVAHYTTQLSCAATTAALLAC